MIYEVSIYKIEPKLVQMISHGYYKTDKEINTKTKYLIKKRKYILAKYIEKVL